MRRQTSYAKSIDYRLGRVLSCPSAMNESRRKSLHWNDETVYALGLYRLIARTLGIWPLKLNNSESRIRLVVIAILQVSM